MDIEIRRSARRKKTVAAQMIGGTLVVYAPLRMSQKELDPIIENLKNRFLKRQQKEQLNKSENLNNVGRRLNEKYLNGLAKFTSIEYVTNQSTLFGSCTIDDGTIRLSSVLASHPKWVRDYVIVHELAHLLVFKHGKKFWSLVNRYPLTERAKGYLLALGLKEE